MLDALSGGKFAEGLSWSDSFRMIKSRLCCLWYQLLHGQSCFISTLLLLTLLLRRDWELASDATGLANLGRVATVSEEQIVKQINYIQPILSSIVKELDFPDSLFGIVGDDPPPPPPGPARELFFATVWVAIAVSVKRLETTCVVIDAM